MRTVRQISNFGYDPIGAKAVETIYKRSGTGIILHPHEKIRRSGGNLKSHHTARRYIRPRSGILTDHISEEYRVAKNWGHGPHYQTRSGQSRLSDALR